MKVRRNGTRESAATETDSAEPEAENTADVHSDDQVEPEAEDTADVLSDDKAEAAIGDTADGRGDETPAEAKSSRERRSISVRSLAIAVVILILAGAIGALAWLYIGSLEKLDAQAAQSANNSRAEKMSLDYAVNAATMDYKDLQAWKVKLVAGTSTELNGKLSDAAKSMEQILVPLQWSSSAEPLAAKVRSTTDGIFVVDCFVGVQTKTVQAPEALQSTATYSITIDSNKDWQITDVGGIGSVVGPK